MVDLCQFYASCCGLKNQGNQRQRCIFSCELYLLDLNGLEAETINIMKHAPASKDLHSMTHSHTLTYFQNTLGYFGRIQRRRSKCRKHNQ